MRFFYMMIITFFTATFCNDLSHNLQRLDVELTTLNRMLPKVQEPVMLSEEQQRNSDYRLALKIGEIARQQPEGLKGPRGFINILDSLHNVDGLAEEKKAFLLPFIDFFKNLLAEDLKLPEKEEAKGIELKTFWIIKDNLLQPSEKFTGYYDKLLDLLKGVFFDDKFLRLSVYPGYTNVAQFVQTLLVSSLVAQRLPSAQLDEDASDAVAADALGYVLSVLEARSERDQDVYDKVFEQFNFLRLRPNFQKFEELLESQGQMLKPILGLLLNPKEIGFSKDAGDAFIGKQYVAPAIQKLFYGDLDEVIATRFTGRRPLNELIAGLLQWFVNTY